MRTNGKFVYPQSGLEHDVIYARKMYCYAKNNPSIVKFAKRQLRKRLRNYGKTLTHLINGK